MDSARGVETRSAGTHDTLPEEGGQCIVSRDVSWRYDIFRSKGPESCECIDEATPTRTWMGNCPSIRTAQLGVDRLESQARVILPCVALKQWYQISAVKAPGRQLLASKGFIAACFGQKAYHLSLFQHIHKLVLTIESHNQASVDDV